MTLSYAHGPSGTPLLGETIGENLRKTVKIFLDFAQQPPMVVALVAVVLSLSGAAEALGEQRCLVRLIEAL